jgi:hypothetical protein
MDYPPAQFHENTTTSAKSNGFTAPTPIELNIETDDELICIKGADGDQVFILYNSINRGRRSGHFDPVLVGLILATITGILVIFGSAIYSLGQRSPVPTISINK